MKGQGQPKPAAVLLALALASPPLAAQQAEGDAEVLEIMRSMNAQLAALGLPIAVEQIEFYTQGPGRPVNRLHQRPFRWVAGDARRLAQGDDITYLIDESDGATASGLSAADTTAALERSMRTWDAEPCLQKVKLVRRPDTGADPDVFDFLLGFGDLGDPFLADVVAGGWMPRAFFEALVRGGGAGVLAASLTFVFTDAQGVPTDVNGDNYLDTSSNEVYFNDNFGDPDGDRPGGPWRIDVPFGLDVETIALHEHGHSLGIGHFGPPPEALMNPVFDGILQQTPLPVDQAGMCAVWASWPR